jgi:hypothetical protein
MATAVIFGLVVATALTLFAVPCLYSLFFEKRRTSARVPVLFKRQEPSPSYQEVL